MFKNVATKIAVFAFDTTTGAPKTGDAANLTAYVAKDYGTTTVLTDTSATEQDATNAKGWYLFDVAQAETNADALLFSGKSSTANISVVGQLVFTTPPNFSALSISAGGLVDILQTAADKVWSTATRALTSLTGFRLSATGIQDVWDALTANLTTASSIGKLLVDNINATIGSRSTLTAQAVWDAATSALTTVGSIGKWILDKLDVVLSTRLASSGYTAPLDAAGTRTAVGLASANLDTQLAATAQDSTVAKAAAVAALNNISTAQVLAQVNAALDAANTEVTAVPASTASLRDMLKYVFAWRRNKKLQTATTMTLRNNADGADIASSTVGDDGTTLTIGKDA